MIDDAAETNSLNPRKKIEDLTEDEGKKKEKLFGFIIFECFGENKTHFTAEINSIQRQLVLDQ